MPREIVTVITPIGPAQAFLLPFIERWVGQQTRRPDQWLIVYDGDGDVPATMGQQVIRRTRGPGEPGNTLPLNLRAALPHIEGDAVIFVEVDDWYSPQYIEHYAAMLERFPLVGEAHARFYHLPRRAWRRAVRPNDGYAALAQTAIRAEVLPVLQQVVENRIRARSPYVDKVLWRTWTGPRRLFTDLNDELCLHCGLKGLAPNHPNRNTHGPANRRMPFNPDPYEAVLRRWIGDEAADLYGQHWPNPHQPAPECNH